MLSLTAPSPCQFVLEDMVVVKLSHVHGEEGIGIEHSHRIR